MENKNIVDFIYTAAVRDGVTTTIKPHTDPHLRGSLVIEFSRRGYRSCVGFDPSYMRNDTREAALLYSMQMALFDLLEHPYRHIGEGAGMLAESLKDGDG